MLTKTRIEVSTEGEIVVLRIGDSIIKLDYEAAIQISQWLRVNGKAAKRAAGDTSRHWSIICTPESLQQ